MPISSQTDNKRHLTILTADGQLTFEEIFKAIKNIQTKNILLEFINAGIGSFSSDELDILSRSAIRHAENRRGGNTAFVALNDSDFEVASLFKALTSTAPRTLKVFREIDEARNWLETKIDG